MKNKKKYLLKEVMSSKKIKISVGVASAVIISVVIFTDFSMAGWNGLVQFFGRVSGASNVSQSILLDGRVYGVNADWNIKINGIVGGETAWNGPHFIENKASVPIKVTLETDPGSSGVVDRVWHDIQMSFGMKAENPSFVKGLDGAYWLFFSGGDCGVSDAGCAAPRGVFYSVSMDEGVTWSSPIAVKAAGAPSGYGDISAVSAGGEIWIFASKGSETGSVTYSRSLNNGATWSAWVGVPGVSGKKISAVYASDLMVLVYQGGSGIYAVSSSNKGSSWSPYITIDARGGSPDAAVGPDGIMRVVWDNDGRGIYLSYSEEDRFVTGSVWKTLAGPVAETPGIFDRDPSLLIDGLGKYWLSYASGDGVTDAVRYAVSEDGFDWSSPKILMKRSGARSVSPEVVEAGAGGVIVFFSSDNGFDAAVGSRNIWLARTGSWNERNVPAVISIPGGAKIGADVSNVFSDRSGESVYSMTTKVR